MKSKWTKVPGGNNLVLESKDETFFISYNPSAADLPEMDVLGDLAQLLTALMGEPDKDFSNRKEETALIKRNDNGIHKYSILRGDFRKQYEHLLPEGYEACLKFFKQHEDEYGSDWSTPEWDK